MARQPERPELYELVTEYFVNNPDQPTSSLAVAEALGAVEDQPALSEVMAALHDNTLRRIAGAHEERVSATSKAFHTFQNAGGLFYRVTIGLYVFDTNATIRRSARRIAGNRWQVTVGAALNNSPKLKSHPYNRLKTIPAVGEEQPAEPVEVPVEPPSVEPEPQPVVEVEYQPVITLVRRLADDNLLVEADGLLYVAKPLVL